MGLSYVSHGPLPIPDSVVFLVLVWYFYFRYSSGEYTISRYQCYLIDVGSVASGGNLRMCLCSSRINVGHSLRGVNA